MKQLYVIPTDGTYGIDKNLWLTNLTSGAVITETEPISQTSDNFSISTKKDDITTVFPEVDVKSLKVTKSSYTEALPAALGIAIPATIEKGGVYSVIIAKKGIPFNERSTWTITTIAKTTDAESVLNDLIKQVNAIPNFGITASNGSPVLYLNADTNVDFTVIGTDLLTGAEVSVVSEYVPATLDKNYVLDLASQCAAGKGFNYPDEGGKELYKGYLSDITADSYTLYTLRFAVPRVASKTRDEVVNQLVHIAVPTTNTTIIGKLDTIFGIGTDSNI